MVMVAPEQAKIVEGGEARVAFDWYEGSGRGARSFPTCSVTKSGSMTINEVAAQALGDPPAVKIGYDAQGSRIALRGALRGDAGAVQLKPSRTMDGVETGSRSMSARSVLTYYGLLPEENHTFRLEDIGGGVWALSLNDPLPKSKAARRAASP